MFPAEFVLVLNPDTVLRPDFLEQLVTALEKRPKPLPLPASCCEWMARPSIPRHRDVRSQRHLDRGADQPDLGQFDKAEDVFGASGAAALYRMKALEDVAIDGQSLTKTSSPYREDADLAWRCRLLGWTSIYTPRAVAYTAVGSTPERRGNCPR